MTAVKVRTESRADRWRRRVVSLGVLGGAFAFVSAFAPVLAVAALAYDAVRRTRGGALRMAVFAWCYLLSEIIGVAALFAIWITSGFGARREALVDATYRVQSRWAGTLFRIARTLFSLRFEIEGDECVNPGPVLVFIRHASLVDTLLPTVFVTARHGIRLRFVLKRELLADPCLDIAGNRLPNHFAARDGRETAAEVAAVQTLATGLTPREGCLIYPEGTRFSPRKRDRALARISTSDPARFERVSRIENLLPPRTGGPLALLDGAPESDVVFFAHDGLGGFTTWKEIVRGGLVGRVVRMRLWRVARSEIPAEREARIAWLDAQWAVMDAWIGTHRESVKVA